jgi:hypothetical protein
MSARALLDADMRTVGVWLTTGLRWWLDELAALVPSRFRRPKAAGLPVIRYDSVLGLIDQRTDGAVALPADKGGNRVVLALPAALCLRRRVERPTFSDRDLDRMLALDCDRIMPLSGDAIIVAGEIVEHRPDGERVVIEVVGLPLARAKPIVDAFSATQYTAESVVVEPSSPGGPSIDLLPAMRQAGMLAKARGELQGWWALVAFLALLNVGVLIWRDAARLDRLDQLVQAQQPAVDIAQRISRRIERVDRIASGAIAMREREPLGLIASLGDALPPGAWIQRLTWTRDGIRLAGYRPKGADVAGGLRRAGLADVRYTNTDSSAGVAAGEPFEVAARLTGH